MMTSLWQITTWVSSLSRHSPSVVQVRGGPRPARSPHFYPPRSQMMMISHQQLSFAASTQGYFIPTGQVNSLAIADLAVKPRSHLVLILTTRCTLKHVKQKLCWWDHSSICITVAYLRAEETYFWWGYFKQSLVVELRSLCYENGLFLFYTYKIKPWWKTQKF